jgi:hypothetical protein
VKCQYFILKYVALGRLIDVELRVGLLFEALTTREEQFAHTLREEIHCCVKDVSRHYSFFVS